MAEGDTVLRAARRVDAALRGERIETAAPNPRGRLARLEQLDGRRLEGVESRGKNLLFDFGELALHSHLGMNGSWRVYRRGESWGKSRAGAWAVLRSERCEAVQFGGPTLEVMPAARLRRKLAALGPDILAPELDLPTSIDLLRADPRRELGEALLDQSLVAGIGNIFKSEACFAARTDPWRRIADLCDSELERVLLAARSLMQEAVESGRRRDSVYRRAGRPCRVCGMPIASRGQGDANRTTYWCPRCQSAAGTLSP